MSHTGFWGEIRAYAQQALLVTSSPLRRGARATRASVVDGGRVEPGRGGDVVVLLHGFLASERVLDPLGERVARATGVATQSVSYGPTATFEAIHERLRAALAALPRGARAHLVGHSLGGVVARYAAVVEPEREVVSTISLAAPFGGVAAARVLPRLGCLPALAPDGPVLRRLREASWGASAVPHLSIVATSDAIVTPPLAHALPGGEVAVLHGRGHNALLFDEEAHRLVVARVRGLSAPRSERADRAAPGR